MYILLQVEPTHHVPRNAVLTSCVVACLLALIYIGSPTAYYALVSLAIVALIQCYICSIASMLYRRLRHPDTLPPSRRWSLGRCGVPMNVLALAWCVWAFFWALWPQATPVDASGFNWAIALYFAAGGLAMLFYAVRQRHVYRGLVVHVEGRKVE